MITINLLDEDPLYNYGCLLSIWKTVHQKSHCIFSVSLGISATQLWTHSNYSPSKICFSRQQNHSFFWVNSCQPVQLFLLISSHFCYLLKLQLIWQTFWHFSLKSLRIQVIRSLLLRSSLKLLQYLNQHIHTLIAELRSCFLCLL